MTVEYGRGRPARQHIVGGVTQESRVQRTPERVAVPCLDADYPRGPLQWRFRDSGIIPFGFLIFLPFLSPLSRYSSGVETLVLAVGENLLRADSDILEVFDYRWDASFRVPLAWLGVNPLPQRNQLMLRVGTAVPVGQVLYGPDVRVVGGNRLLFISWDDEPTVRAFFGQIADHVGRLMKP